MKNVPKSARYDGAGLAAQILVENGNRPMRQRDIVGEVAQRAFGGTSKADLRRALICCRFFGAARHPQWVKVSRGVYRLTDEAYAKARAR